MVWATKRNQMNFYMKERAREATTVRYPVIPYTHAHTPPQWAFYKRDIYFCPFRNCSRFWSMKSWLAFSLDWHTAQRTAPIYFPMCSNMYPINANIRDFQMGKTANETIRKMDFLFAGVFLVLASSSFSSVHRKKQKPIHTNPKWHTFEKKSCIEKRHKTLEAQYHTYASTHTHTSAKSSRNTQHFFHVWKVRSAKVFPSSPIFHRHYTQPHIQTNMLSESSAIDSNTCTRDIRAYIHRRTSKRESDR